MTLILILLSFTSCKKEKRKEAGPSRLKILKIYSNTYFNISLINSLFQAKLELIGQ